VCTARWLQLAREGGAGLNLPVKPRRPKLTRGSPAKRARQPKKQPESQDQANPLRNVKTASKEDRARWHLLEAGACQQVCFPCLPRFPATPPTTGALGLGASTLPPPAAVAEGQPQGQAELRSCLATEGSKSRRDPRRGVKMDGAIAKVTSIPCSRNLKDTLWWHARDLTPAPKRQRDKTSQAAKTKNAEPAAEQPPAPKRSPGRPPGSGRPTSGRPGSSTDPPGLFAADNSQDDAQKPRPPPGPKAGLKRKRELDKLDGAPFTDTPVASPATRPHTQPVVQSISQSRALSSAELRMAALRRRILDKQSP
jgi:hypothetical protein